MPDGGGIKENGRRILYRALHRAKSHGAYAVNYGRADGADSLRDGLAALNGRDAGGAESCQWTGTRRFSPSQIFPSLFFYKII